MRRAVFVAFLLMLGSVVLGATVLREPIAWAASPFTSVIVANDASAPVPAKVTNDASAPVPVTVGNLPPVQNVAVQAPELWGKRVVLAGTNPAVFICPPAGKKFIVQSFSARATVPEGSHIVVYMRAGDFDSGVYLPSGRLPGTFKLAECGRGEPDLRVARRVTALVLFSASHMSASVAVHQRTICVDLGRRNRSRVCYWPCSQNPGRKPAISRRASARET